MNEKIIYKIKLDLVHNSISNFVHIMQYDDGISCIKAEIFKDWQPIILTDEFSLVTLRLRKADESVIIYDSLVNPDKISFNGISVNINIDFNMTNVDGKCPAVLDFTDTTGHVQTARFVLDIDRNPVQREQSIINIPIDVEERLDLLEGEIAKKIEDVTVDGESVVTGNVAEISTENLMHLTGDETVTGVKTFSDKIAFSNSSSSQTNSIETDIYGSLSIKRSGVNAVGVGGTDVRLYNRHLLPQINNTLYSIGSPDAKWKDLYLSGKIDFSTTVGQSYKGYITSTSAGISIGMNDGTNDYDMLRISGYALQLTRHISVNRDNAWSIGTKDGRVKDIYLSGILSDGTNSVTIQGLSKKVDDVKVDGTSVVTDKVAEISTANLMHLTGDETVTGVKTFSDDVHLNGAEYFYNSDSSKTVYWSIKTNQYENLEIDRNGSGLYSFGSSGFFPNSNNQRDLGTKDLKFKDAYLSGKVDFGTKVSGRTNTTYITTDNSDGLSVFVNGIRPVVIYDNAIYFNKNLLANNNNIEIGSSNRPIKIVYTTYLNDGQGNSISIEDIVNKPSYQDADNYDDLNTADTNKKIGRVNKDIYFAIPTEQEIDFTMNEDEKTGSGYTVKDFIDELHDEIGNIFVDDVTLDVNARPYVSSYYPGETWWNIKSKSTNPGEEYEILTLYSNPNRDVRGINFNIRNGFNINNQTGLVATNYSGKHVRITAFDENDTELQNYEFNLASIAQGTDPNDISEYTADISADRRIYYITVTIEIDDDGYTEGGLNFNEIGIGFNSENPQYKFTEMAKEERVSELEDNLTEIDEFLDTRIANTEGDVSELQGAVTKIQNDLGDVQIIDRRSLPYASSEYAKKLCRVDKKLYQCVSDGDFQSYSMENVSGTSEITSSNYDSFAGQVGRIFAERFGYESSVRCYRNDGSIKLGSSGSTGRLALKQYYEQGISQVIIYCKAYRNDKPSRLQFYTDESTEISYIDITQTDQETRVVFDAEEDAGSIMFSSAIVGTTNTYDPRVIITKIEVVYGDNAYRWEEISSGGGEIKIEPKYTHYVAIRASGNAVTLILTTDSDQPFTDSDSFKQYVIDNSIGKFPALGTYDTGSYGGSHYYAGEIQNMGESTALILYHNGGPSYIGSSFEIIGDIVQEAGAGGGGSGNAAKQIQLSVQRKLWDLNSGYIKRLFLYIHLINFDSSDIGKCIFLYRKSMQSAHSWLDDDDNTHSYRGKERYKHPVDLYSNYLEAPGISTMGYFDIEGKQSGTDYTYPLISDLPINLPRGGTIQTEWVLTKEDIDKGFIEINVSESWTPLIMPNKRSYDNFEPQDEMFWTKILGTRNDLGHHRSLSIKFGLVNSEGNSECMSQDTVKFGNIASARSCLIIDGHPDANNKSDVILNWSNIYMQIK